MKPEYLNDLEVELVEAFVKNETQREAVRKVLLAGIYENGTLKPGEKANTLRNWVLAYTPAFAGENGDLKLSNEHIGSNVRAVAEGLRTVELAFDKLLSLKKPDEVTKSKPNPAR